MAEFFGFRKMVSSLIIKILYFLGAIALTVAGIIYTINAFLPSFKSTDVNMLIRGLGLLIFGNLLWRVVCESSILLFSIHDTLVSIDRKLGNE